MGDTDERAPLPASSGPTDEARTTADAAPVADVVEQFRLARQGATLGDLTIRALIEEGRP